MLMQASTMASMLPSITRRLSTCRFTPTTLHCQRLITSGAKRKQKENGILKKRRAGTSQNTPLSQSNTTTQSPKEGASPLHFFFAIFPIAAAATLVAVKPELQEQVKANWNMNDEGGKKNGVQEKHMSHQEAASAGSDVENASR
jgi:hypothetical protein